MDMLDDRPVAVEEDRRAGQLRDRQRRRIATGFLQGFEVPDKQRNEKTI